MLRLLCRLNDGALVDVALVVNVELAEGILQPEDLALLELRVFPARNALLAAVEAGGGAWKYADATHFCSLMMFIVAEVWGVDWGDVCVTSKDIAARQSLCLAQPREFMRNSAAQSMRCILGELQRAFTSSSLTLK